MRPDERVPRRQGDEYEPELEVDLFGLMAAFRGCWSAPHASRGW
jgi:hypothetical protein